jgi:hypothetical protein
MILIAAIFFAGLIGLNYYQLWSDWLLSNIQIPRVHRLFTSGRLSGISLGDLFTSTWNISIPAQKRIASVMVGIFLGGVFLALAWVVYRFLQKKSVRNYTLVNVVVSCCLIAGTVLPFGIDWISNKQECSTHFLSYYEEAGKSLSKLIPPGSQLYWRGSGRHLAFMLYVDNVKIFPPQIHAGAGYAEGETERLFRLGFFNEELDKQWRESADILIVWDTYFTEDVREFFNQPRYEPIPYDMGNLANCEDVLHVFRRTS